MVGIPFVCFALRAWALFCVGVLAVWPWGEAWAQFPPQAGIATLPADTAQADSLPQIAPLALRVDVPSLRLGHERQDSLGRSLRLVHYWDEADTLPGFKTILGQIGKPYVAYQYGLPGRFWATPQLAEPVIESPDVYLLNPATQIPVLDTRTPYLDLGFDQNSRDMQQFRVVGSQNINPFWNVTFFYRRRTAQGVYLNNRTDQLNLGLGQYFRSRTRRYAGVLMLAFSELNDDLNGGTQFSAGQDANSAFAKLLQPVVFGTGQTELVRRMRNVWTDHHFRIVNDSAFQAGIVAGGRHESYDRRYTDRTTTANPMLETLLSWPYPGLVFDSIVGINEHLIARTLGGHTGGILNLSLPGLEVRNRVEVGLANSVFSGPLAVRGQTKQHLDVHSRLGVGRRLLRLDADVHLRQTSNNLMAPELLFDAQGALGFGYRPFEVRDSSVIDTTARLYRDRRRHPLVFTGAYSPFSLHFQMRLLNQNPSLRDRFWMGETFRGNAGLTNEQVYFTRGGAQWMGRPRMGRAQVLPQNYGRIGAAFTRHSNPVFLNFSAQPGQRQGTVSYLTLEADFQVRVWRLSVESHTSYMVQSADTDAPEWLATRLPDVFGKAAVRFEDMLIRRNLNLMVGLEAQYFTQFVALKFEPSVQGFYPGVPVWGYARLDAVVAARIKMAMVYVKINHLNEGMGRHAGYYTVPFHPMLERSFSFGVRWLMFD